jgi:hypothetical protein
MYEIKAVRRALVRKGPLNNEGGLEEIKTVRWRLEEKRGRRGKEILTAQSLAPSPVSIGQLPPDKET